MKYSVLMSVYKKEKPLYLKQAIESMIKQTVPPDDFVLVCDGELTKELEAVIDLFSSILTVVRIPKNCGLGNALNIGLQHCKNELVARMDSDDISVPERCEKQLAVFAENAEIDITSGTVQEFYSNPGECVGYRKVPSNQQDIIKYSRKRCPFNHPCVMFKKSAIVAAGEYNGNFRMEDYYLWVRLLQRGCIGKNIDDVLLYMRTTQDMYRRRGGKTYTKDLLRFHWWLYRSGWSSLFDFFTGAVPHAVVCVVPNSVRGIIYNQLHQ